MAEPQPFYILALDGGGSRGIYPAQLLANLERELGVPVRDCFDLIAGTSTGSIIAGAAAAGIGMAAVVELFEREAPRIFRRNPLRLSWFCSRYDYRILASVIRRALPHQTLGQIDTPLLLTSSDLSSGGVYVFKSRYLQEMGKDYVRDGNVPLADAILASCAAPTYFDPAAVGNYLLADGGVWANNPSLIALTEAVSAFGKDLAEINILSLGTGHTALFYRKQRSWGAVTGWGGIKLFAYLMSAQAQGTANMAGLLLQDRYRRLDPEIDHWKMDDTKHLGNLKALADRDFAAEFRQIQAGIKGGTGWKM